MVTRALVVEDSDKIAREVGDILESLGHKADIAGDMESARKFLGPDKYSYVLLDLEIPVKPGRLCRIENGKNLLAEIRGTAGMETVPVIVMTAHGNDSPDLAVSVLKSGAVDYVKKPFTGDQLDKAIREVLGRAREGSAAGGRAKPAPKALAPFSAEKRPLVVHADRVTICGVTVWRETQHAHMRAILTKLSGREDGRYVRIDGRHLNRELGRNASNPVARLIKEFRDRATELMANECSLECGSGDIIGSRAGGYHLKEWIDARMAGAEPEVRAATPRAEALPIPPAKKIGGPELNERQAWILDQLRKGVQLKRQDIIRHTKKNRSTINRDIKELRDAGLIETHPDGHYVDPKA